MAMMMVMKDDDNKKGTNYKGNNNMTIMNNTDHRLQHSNGAVSRVRF